MPESIYHVTALYCGEPRLMFAGYASHVARRFHSRKDFESLSQAAKGYKFSPSRDKFGNALPYTLWSGPIAIAEYVPTTEVIEYEGESQ